MLGSVVKTNFSGSNSDELSLLSNLFRKTEEKILGLFRYGSFVYGTNLDDSDRDYIIILSHVRNPHNIIEKEYEGMKFSLVPHTEITFQRGLWAHEPYAMETFFLPGKDILKPYEKSWDLERVDKKVLRHSFAQKASHSYVKAKKKLEVEGDIKRGKKSLFHSLRILSFGIQLAKFDKIVDYSEANEFWWDIWTSPETGWSAMEKKYRPVYNKLSTNFREVCPK